MVKDKAINVKPYKMERNGKEILVSGHSRQAKGVNKEFPVKVKSTIWREMGKQFISQNIEDERETLIEIVFLKVTTYPKYT